MALCHHFFALSKQPTTPYKSSTILGAKAPSHAYCCYHNKSDFTIALKQNFHISKNEKSREGLNTRHAKALDEVKRVLVTKIRKNTDQGLLLSMVDSIQRLGIEYHFEEEIDVAIKKNHHELMLRIDHGIQLNDHYDHGLLPNVAFQFRMLRQHGYYIHADIFDKFWDTEGKLRDIFCEDVDGLMAMFEASQLSIEGESCLDEAGELCRQYLKEWLSRFHEHPQVNVVAHTLGCPVHKTLSRFSPTINIQSQNAAGWTTSLQQLSYLDTQFINSLHLKEIFAVSKWWKDLGLAKELEFARDEPMKWYMWSMACLPDPRFSEERIELTKPLSLIYIIDDVFDFYGNIDQLTLFTDAVKRWDLAAMEQLPECMKVCFKALYDITNEFAYRTQIKHGWNPISSLIKSWVGLLNAFLQEAKWFGSGQVPKSGEYLKNAIVSTGVHVILVHAFFFMGQGITEQTVSLIDDFPTIISATAKILRLCDDLQGDREVDDINDGDGNGNDGSYSECYMKEHPGISVEETNEHINELILGAWKILNKQSLNNTNTLPSSFTKLCLNAARMVPLMYSYESDSPSKLEEYAKSLLLYHHNINNNAAAAVHQQVPTI